MKLIFRDFSFIRLIILVIIPIFFHHNSFVFSNELENKNKKENIDIQKDFYLLGPGDTLSIKFLNDENLSTRAKILSDGSISLPLVGPIYVDGLTIKEATDIVENEMSKELIKPIVQLTIEEFRPIRISLIGELKKPGIYILDQDTQSKNRTGTIFPRLADAIQEAGGITPNSNLSDVIITRRIPSLEKPEYKKTNINLFELILNGKQEFNPYLFDGDIIKVKKTKYKNNNFMQISKANFTNQSIEVNIIGEVVNPSKVSLPSNSSLIQGILNAGGLKNNRSSKSNVELIRLDEVSGTISKRYYYLDLNKGFDSDKNPILLDNDVVVVKRSNLAKVSDSLSAIANPISSTLQVYTLLKILD